MFVTCQTQFQHAQEKKTVTYRRKTLKMEIVILVTPPGMEYESSLATKISRATPTPFALYPKRSQIRTRHLCNDIQDSR